MSKVTVTIPVGEMKECSACAEPFGEAEERVVVMYAGSAWQEGKATLVKGAELYTAKVFHDRCTPARPVEEVSE